MADYDLGIQYQLCKLNLVSDALNKKSMAICLTQQLEILEDMRRFVLEVILPNMST